ncbi:MAG: DUF1587 domain-containing protein [Gammaproteobacteria bacterium]|nr:DUF1587 domain-containing protein [Gammaproteobacteria bacterium]
MMPPVGEDRPAKEALQGLAHAIADQLDSKITVIPAAPSLHRLNRAEYKNAIRDLLSLDIDTNTLLPRDNSSDGFDNIAESLGFSPALVQAYTSAAMKISRWAVGDMTTTESSSIYLPPADLMQDRHLDGMPLGTRGEDVFSVSIAAWAARSVLNLTSLLTEYPSRLKAVASAGSR